MMAESAQSKMHSDSRYCSDHVANSLGSSTKKYFVTQETAANTNSANKLA